MPKPTPTLDIAYHLVSEDEPQREISTTKKPSQEVAVFQTFTQSMRETMNIPTIQRMKGVTKDEHCSFCGKNSHNKDGCFKTIGYPEKCLGKGKNEKGIYKATLVNEESSLIPRIFE